ncbi:hypothetical protein HYW46_06210 [Candidatus Daviesbacteria bacterium]|nr:hypothetical protein [Candidatus Daviesbacteria bacterium]
MQEVFAQCPGPDCPPGSPPRLTIISYFLSNIISFALLLAGIVAVYFIIISGIKLITSGGDQIKVHEAKQSITYALVGLIIILLSFTIIKVFSVVTGVDCNVLGVAC